MTSSAARWWVAALLSTTLLLLGAWLGFRAAGTKSLTYDERYYVSHAADIAGGKSPCSYTLHPPIAKELTAVAVLLRGDTALPWIRVPHLVLFVLFGGLVAAWSAALYGAAAAVAASVLYAFSPNLLAHASLATTDFPLTATFGASLFAFRAFLLTPSVPRALLFSVALAAALLTKLTALVLLPAIVLVAALLFATRSVPLQRAHCWGLVLAPVVLLGLGWLVYGMSLCGLEAYAQEFRLRVHQSETGAGLSVYVLGKVFQRGVWYFFLVTTALKEPLPFLALLGIAAFRLPRPRGGQREVAFLLIPAAVLFVAASVGIHQLGHRYILPLFPLLIVWVSGLAVPERLGRGRWLVWGALFLYVGDVARIQPHYLAYFNQLVGSPERGYHYLADSNVDWLQDDGSPEIVRLKERWDVIDLNQSPLRFDDAKPPALLLGATELSGVWAEAGFWGSAFTRLVRERNYPHVAHVGYSKFLFPIDSIGLYRDLYDYLLSRSWVDARNWQHRFALLVSLDEPPLPAMTPTGPLDSATCERGVGGVVGPADRSQVTIVGGFDTPAGDARVRWIASWRVERAGEYLLELPPEVAGNVALNGRNLPLERATYEKSPRFVAVALEAGVYLLHVERSGGETEGVALKVAQLQRDGRGYWTAEGLDVAGTVCLPDPPTRG